MPKRDESPELRKKRARKIVAKFRRLYPEADCALRHGSALELLLSTILSAQCTDETVNKVAPVLFRRFASAKALADAPLEALEEIVHSTGFFRQKAKSIKQACRRIVDEFGGEVPETMEGLMSLPGVARKTANVVLSTWFGQNVGVVVDTHVGRLSERLGLSWRAKNGKDAVKIELDLMEVLPKKDWTYVSHALIHHGRRVCTARKPNCNECDLATLCPAYGSMAAGA